MTGERLEVAAVPSEGHVDRIALGWNLEPSIAGLDRRREPRQIEGRLPVAADFPHSGVVCEHVEFIAGHGREEIVASVEVDLSGPSACRIAGTDLAEVDSQGARQDRPFVGDGHGGDPRNVEELDLDGAPCRHLARETREQPGQIRTVVEVIVGERRMGRGEGSAGLELIGDRGDSGEDLGGVC